MGIVAENFVGTLTLEYQDKTVIHTPIDSGLFHKPNIWKHNGERPISATMPMVHILDCEFVRTIKYRMHPIKSNITFLEDNQ